MHHEHATAGTVPRWVSTCTCEVFGHAGARLIVFPTSMGGCTSGPTAGCTRASGEHLERGWLQMFCVDQVNDGELERRASASRGQRAWRHLQYDEYLRDELLPFTASLNANPFVITTGASLGAYQAVCFGLRHPDLVHRIIGMSGIYDIKRLTGGYSDENVYRCNPMDFMRHEHDPDRLEAFRRQDIILAIGRDDPMIGKNRDFSGVLWGRGIGNALREWDGWAHDWPYWERMLPMYVGGHD